MTIAAGTRVGPYEVIGPIGSGGMGEVYRARDPRLARDVALKTLPALATPDPDRLARFQREAQLLAALSHAHIASIYGLEETGDGCQVLILELVDGGTLADRLSTGPLPIQEALTIARQVADGVHAAHESGIVHRDLKPANIALTHAGQAKVLDFGVAKTFARDVDAVTVQHDPTREGIVLGTAAYMSPEQTRGLKVDKRADIWAFGCVLYEMLTGRRAFAGQTVSDVVAAVLGNDPDLTALPEHTPARVRWLVRRCLAKDPARRLHDIADARIELDEALGGASGADVETVAPSLVRRTSSRVAWTVAAISVAALAGILIAAARGAFAPAAGDRGLYRASVMLPDQLRLAALDPAGRFAISPDGRYLALVASDAGGQSRLWIRALDSVVAQPLAGTEGAAYPFWSPDSRHVAFIERRQEGAGASGRIKRIGVTGGEAITLCETAFIATGAWGSDDVILFTPRGDAPLHRVPATGGAPVPLTSLDATRGEVQHSYPSFLPDGRRFLFSTVGSTGSATDPGGVYVGSLDEGSSVTLLVEGASHPRYANGHLLYVRGSTVLAQRFDPGRLEIDGEPRPLVDQIQVSGRAGSGITGAYTVSESGVLAYQTTALVRAQLVWVDRTGRQLGQVGDAADLEDVALSPNASHAAVSVRDPAFGTRDLWLYDLGRGLRERFTFDPSDEIAPAWAPDGTELIYTSTRGGGINLIRTRVRDPGTDQTLQGDGLGLGRFAANWSRDGQFLVYIAGGRIIARSDLWIAPLSGSGKPYPFLETPFVETHGRFSPDGRWLAFTSNTSGVPEVYVTAFPSRGERTRVSAAGGGWPRWRDDGKEIVYLAADGQMMSAAVAGDGPAFRVDRVEPLFTVRMRPSTRLDAYLYDMSSDGQRFLVSGFVDDIKPGAITLVVNWPEELKK